MKFNHKIKISLLDFLREGKFDILKIGMTKEVILSNFPYPDGCNGNHVDDSDLWFYGNSQWTFSNEVLVSLTLIRNLEWKIDLGEHFEVDKWILDRTERLSLIGIIEKLNSLDIDFVKYKRVVDSMIHVQILKSKVQLWFEIDKEPNDVNRAKLIYLTLKDTNFDFENYKAQNNIEL